MAYSRKVLGENIRKKRIELGFTQAKLGEKLEGITGKMISKYENGSVPPSIDLIYEMCELFKCEPGYLLGEDGYENGSKKDTDVVAATGLSVDALHAIQSLTGVIDGEPNCMRLLVKYESEKTRSILNRLLTSDIFMELFNSIFDLETSINDTKGMFQDVIDEVGQDKFDEVLGLYTSDVGYGYDRNAPELTEEQIHIWNLIDKAIDENMNEEEKGMSIRYKRYETAELFNQLIYQMYPRQHNETLRFHQKI